MTQLKDSKAAKVFDVAIYKFIIQLISGILLLSAVYWLLVGRVDTNEREIGINAVYGKATRKITVDHIDYTKGAPLTELEMTLAVEGLEEDVDELEVETDLNTEGRILHDKNMAVQAVQYRAIINKLEELIDK